MQAQLEREVAGRRTGELLAAENGKITGVRVLADGGIEESFQGVGKLLGIDDMAMYTAVGKLHSGGVTVFEANGIVSTIEGESLTVKIWGVGRATGVGFKASLRGGAITQTTSQKLQRLNNAPNVWESEVDEAGNYHLKVWEWK